MSCKTVNAGYSTALKKAFMFVYLGAIVPCASAFNEQVDFPSWTPNVNKALAAAEYQKELGCKENWREFYWAKRLPPNKLLVACMADGKLIVAPRGAGSVYSLQQGVKPFESYSHYNSFPMLDVTGVNSSNTSDIFSVLIKYGVEHGAVSLSSMLKSLDVTERDKPPVSFNEYGLHGGFVLKGKTLVCSWPKKFSTSEVLARGGPFICGLLEKGKLKVSYITYSDDGTSSVFIRLIPAGGLPPDFNPIGFYEKHKTFTSTFRKKI